jgi:pimeloyl-ACP methyl ester carboxylesterase
MVPVNGIELCVETFGERCDPPLLLIAADAASMDWWEDEFCRRLAAEGRFVVRYDHRDTGRSASPAGAPPCTATDLAHDALGVLDALGLHRAHLVGMAMGAGLALQIAAERPHRVLSLALMAATADPAGCPRRDRPEPDWAHRRSAVDHLVAEMSDAGGVFTADPQHLRRLAERCFDRTLDMAAARRRPPLDWAPTAARLAAVAAPTLVLHGTLDPVVPGDHAVALAGAIRGARLVWLEGVGHEVPPSAVWSRVITEITGEPGRSRQIA